MKLGLNVAATSTLADYGGSALVRYPLWRGLEPLLQAHSDALLDGGIDPIMVLDRAAFTKYGWDTGRYTASMKRWKTLFPNAPIIEAGNEPDGTGESSSTMSRARFRALLEQTRKVWPDAFIVSGGLVGIDVSYLDAIDGSPINAVGFHPYAQDADSVKLLIAEIRRHTSKPLWATELGQEYVASDEHARAQWLTDLLISLWEEGVEAACIYCGKMDQGPFGLVEADDTPLESWAAYTNAIPALAGPR